MQRPIQRFLRRSLPASWNPGPHQLEILAGASWSLFLKLLNVGSAFLLILVVARRFGAEGSGAYFLALSVAGVATTLGQMGLDLALVRFVAGSSALGRWREVLGVHRMALGLALAASLALSVLLYLAAPFLAGQVFHKPGMVSPLRAIVIAVVPLVLLNLQGEAFRGLKRLFEHFLFSRFGLPLLCTAIILVLPPGSPVLWAVAAYGFCALALAAAALLWWRHLLARRRGLSPRFDRGKLLHASGPLLAVALLDYIANNSAVFFLGVWASQADVAVFSTAARTSMLVSLVLTSVNIISAPKFAALYRRGDRKTLSTTARYTARLVTLVAGPALLALMLFPSFFLGLFGGEFRVGSTALVLLAAGQFVNVATGSVGLLLAMTGHERILRNRALGIAALSLALNLLLTPRYGVLGAAIATAVSVAATNLAGVLLVWSKLGIWTLPFLPAPGRPAKGR